jgi:hypothetical protein
VRVLSSGTSLCCLLSATGLVLRRRFLGLAPESEDSAVSTRSVTASIFSAQGRFLQIQESWISDPVCVGYQYPEHLRFEQFHVAQKRAYRSIYYYPALNLVYIFWDFSSKHLSWKSTTQEFLQKKSFERIFVIS